MKRVALSLFTALLMLFALVGALFLFRPLNTFATFARADALRALIEPFVVSLQQQVPVTLTVQLPGADEAVSLPVLLDVNLNIGLSSTVSGTVDIATVTPEPTVALLTPTPTREPSELGTRRSNAAPMGQSVVSTNNIEVTVLEARRGAAAWAEIQKGSQYNNAPSAGNEYLHLQVLVRNLSDDTDATFTINESQFRVVGSEGVIYSNAYHTLRSPVRADLFGGGRREGEVVFQVPEGETDFVLIYTPVYNAEPRYLQIVTSDTPPVEPTATPTAEPQTGDQPDLTNAFTGLEEQDTYQVYTLVAVEGVGEDGTAIDSYIEMEMAVDTQQSAVALTAVVQGGEHLDFTVDEGEFAWIRIRDEAWTRQNNEWIAGDTNDLGEFTEFQNMGPGMASMAGQVDHFTLADESALLNGIETTHYSFGYDDLRADVQESMGEVDSVEGEMWLAKEGGYIVRFTMLVSGPAVDTVQPVDGTVEIVYDVFGVNEPVDIAPPDLDGGNR